MRCTRSTAQCRARCSIYIGIASIVSALADHLLAVSFLASERRPQQLSSQPELPGQQQQVTLQAQQAPSDHLSAAARKLLQMGRVNGSFESFGDVTSRLGHSKLAVLKMDIEGFEYQVLADLKEGNPALPEQIAVEFHFATDGEWVGHMPPVAAKNQVQMSLTFMHLANLGYAVVSREDNPSKLVGCCAEYSFLKVEQVMDARKRLRKMLQVMQGQ